MFMSMFERDQWLKTGSIATVLIVVTALLFRSSDETVDVSGTVYVDGQPVAGATVFFLSNGTGSQGNEKPSGNVHGTTDDSGVYQLVSRIVPGKYRVVVRGMLNPGEAGALPGLGQDGVDAAQLEAAESAKEADERSQWRPVGRTKTSALRMIPDEFSNAELTVLRVDVPESGTESADLHLTVSAASPTARIALQQ